MNGLVRSYGVSFDSHENIFIPDMPANNIVKLNNEFNIIAVYDIKKDKLVNCSYIGKTNKKQNNDKSLVSPHFISFDKFKNFYVAEFNAGRISIFSKDMNLKKRFYCVQQPVSIFVENETKVYITDYKKNEVILLDPLKEEYKSFINSDELIKLGLTKIDRPHGFAKCSNGFFYLSDTWNNRILRFNKSGKFLGWCGSGSKNQFIMNQGFKGKPNHSSDFDGFDTPVDLKISNDFIYVCDMKNHRIKKLTLLGKTIGIFYRFDKFFELPKNNIYDKNKSHFNEPYGLSITKNAICVSDTNNQRVIRFKTKGNLD